MKQTVKMAFKLKKLSVTYHFGIMCICWIRILKQGLELIVLCERDNLQDCPKLGENLNKKPTSQFMFQCFPGKIEMQTAWILQIMLFSKLLSFTLSLTELHQDLHELFNEKKLNIIYCYTIRSFSCYLSGKEKRPK